MISQAHSSCAHNMPIDIEDLEKFGISTSLLRKLAPLAASPAPAQADVGELFFFHVKRRVQNAKFSSPCPKIEEAGPRYQAVAVG